MPGMVTNGIKRSHSNLAAGGKGAGHNRSGRGASSDLPGAQVRPRIKGACAVAAGAVTAVWPLLALGFLRYYVQEIACSFPGPTS